MSVLDRCRLDDEVAVVTGASSGLGVASAAAAYVSGSTPPVDGDMTMP
jgi:NADP-dependent 3-hydroxy acid dehydrogenase YdfG